jgi:hypothetical protein
MTEGARYVVFATTIRTTEEASALPGSEVGGLTSGLCSGTAELGPDGPPVFLGAGRPPTGAPTATPTPSDDSDDGLPGWVLPTAVGAGLVALAAVGAFVVARRRRPGARSA